MAGNKKSMDIGKLGIDGLFFMFMEYSIAHTSKIKIIWYIFHVFVGHPNLSERHIFSTRRYDNLGQESLLRRLKPHGSFVCLDLGQKISLGNWVSLSLGPVQNSASLHGRWESWQSDAKMVRQRICNKDMKDATLYFNPYWYTTESFFNIFYNDLLIFSNVVNYKHNIFVWNW